MPYLLFISDDNLITAVKKVITTIESAQNKIDSKLYKNVLDPFSALFDGITHGLDYDEWIKSEKVRQIQKTMQNAIGDFHQDVLGSSINCENLGTGGGLDVCNRKKKIIAEVKNKFNTTKGNHKVEIYDTIKGKLKTLEFGGYTGYYVEVIPPNKKIYNKPFVPSDSKTKKRRPVNENIRVVDGKSFYKLMTGDDYALQDLFESLPKVIIDNFSYKFDKNEASKYLELFNKAFEV
jgi:Eco47II restriction endonuclease